MIHPPESLPQVYLCREPVDMRKSIDGLAAMVEGVLGRDPFSAQLFVFANRRRDKVKCLWWERNGFCLWYKRLERERFHWPVHLPGEPIVLTGQQINWLLDGYDLRHWRAHQPLAYKGIL